MTSPVRVLATLETPWRGQAACRRDTATAFFPPPHFEMKPEKDERENQARALCRACPVQRDCLEYSLEVREPHGIWGGLNELERRRMLRQRGSVAQRTA
jgi:WhiB family redox-sensing transcriptional regulator